MATNKLQGLTISIGGDTTELSNALKKPNKEVSDIQSKLKTLNQALKVDPSNVELLEQKYRLLGTAIDKNEDKLKLLKNAQQQFINEGRDIDSTEYIELQKQIALTTKKVRDLEKEQGDVSNSLKNFDTSGIRHIGKEIDNLDDSIEDVDRSSSSMKDALKGAFIGGGIVEGIGAIVSSMGNLIDQSKETIKIMSSLGVSSRLSGYSIKETKESYNQLYGVLGDNQTTATTVANLQALGLEQDKLTELTEGTIGAWAKYGDSIPIDGLAEAINETVKTSKVTGTFADVLNWAGTNEDKFNEKLEKTKDASQRANLILEELNKQGLTEAASGWRENAGYLVDMNLAQSKWEQATASMAEKVMPYFAMIKGGMADILDTTLGVFTGEISFDQFISSFDSMFTNVLSSFSTFGQQLITKGLNMLVSLSQGFAQGYPNFMSSIYDLIQNFANYIAENAPMFIQKGFEVLSNLVQGIINALPVMIEKIPQIITTFANIINDNFPTILMKGAELLWQLITGILSAIPDLIANIPQIIEAIWSTIMAFNWLNLGKNIIDFLGKGIKSMFNFIKSNASGIAKNIWDALTHLPQTLWNLGKNMISKMGSSITNATGTVGGAIKGVFNAVVNGIKSLPSKMLDIGKNIVKGIWDGITGMADWLWGKVKGWADDILGGIMGFFGIHSPSRVMRDLIGKNLVAGIGEGILQNDNLALNPLRQLEKEMQTSISPNVSSTINRTLSLNNRTETIVPVQIDLEGKPIVNTVIRQITRSQSLRTNFKGA